MNTNNEWLTAKEISDAAGIHVSSVLRRASRDEWPKRPRHGRGGGYEYELTGLPADLQGIVAKYLANQLASTSPEFAAGKAVSERNRTRQKQDETTRQRIQEQGAIDFGRLTGKARERAEARVLIVSAWRQYLQPYIARKQKTRGEQAFADDYNQHRLAFSADIYRTVQTISWMSVRRWADTLEQDGAAALAGKYQVNERPHRIDADHALQQFCRGLLWHQPDMQAVNLREAIRGQIELGKLAGRVPSESAVRRWLAAFRREFELVLAQLRNPDDFKNRRQVAWGNAAENVLRINQLWELDSTPSDVLLTDGRHSIVGGIDVFSRRPIVIVHPTSSAEAVCLLLRKAVLEFGVPEAVKTDNGRDYTSKRVMSVLGTLGVEQVLTRPFAGDEKPHIERFFKTWAHGISTLLPGYGGHNVAKRQEIRARTSFAERIMAKRQEKGDDGKLRLSKGADVEVSLTAKELQSIIDDWINHHYLHKAHRKLGRTPFDQWQSQRTTIRTIENERALDVLLSPVPASGGRQAGVRTANKDAGIVVESISYYAPELGALIGQQLYCAWDPHDVGQIYVFNATTLAFVCTAKNPELAGQGISLGELSRAARQQQSQQLAQQKKHLRQAARKVSAGEVATDVLAAAKRRHASLGALPHRTEPMDTAALRGAETALNQPSAPARMDRDEFQRRREEALEAERLAHAAANARPRFRNEFEEFMYLLRVLKTGERSLSNEEIVKVANFRQQFPERAQLAEKMLDDGREEKASR